MWMGGVVPLGYRVEARLLLVEPAEAENVHKGQVFRGQHEAIIDTSLWDAVQAVFATKGRTGQHYRYYVPKSAQAFGTKRGARACTRRRSTKCCA